MYSVSVGSKVIRYLLGLRMLSKIVRVKKEQLKNTTQEKRVSKNAHNEFVKMMPWGRLQNKQGC